MKLSKLMRASLVRGSITKEDGLMVHGFLGVWNGTVADASLRWLVIDLQTH